MKKSLLIAGLLLAGTTGAWAQVFTDIHTPYRWHRGGIDAALRNLYSGPEYSRLSHYVCYEMDNIVDMSAAELCDRYEAACRIYGIPNKPCDKFIATVVEAHDIGQDYYAKRSQEKLSWDNPDKVATFSCNSVEGLCEIEYDQGREGDGFKACTEFINIIYEQKCKDDFAKLQMSPRGLYNICQERASRFGGALWSYRIDNKHDVCRELTDVLIGRVNGFAEIAEKRFDEYSNSLQPSKQDSN